SGLITGVGAGSATISATSKGKSAAATVTVRDGAWVGPAGGTAVTSNEAARVDFPAGSLWSRGGGATDVRRGIPVFGDLPGQPIRLVVAGGGGGDGGLAYRR
ncbi:MAG: hypothetical protein ABI877_20125, partial [Gemmatimonadaceae bacterium]